MGCMSNVPGRCNRQSSIANPVNSVSCVWTNDMPFVLSFSGRLSQAYFYNTVAALLSITLNPHPSPSPLTLALTLNPHPSPLTLSIFISYQMFPLYWHRSVSYPSPLWFFNPFFSLFVHSFYSRWIGNQRKSVEEFGRFCCISPSSSRNCIVALLVFS